MRISKLLAGAGLALTLSAFVPVAWSQTGNGTSGNENATAPGSENNPNSGTEVNPSSSNPNENNPGAANNGSMGTMGNMGAQKRATQVQREIEQARSSGKDVSTAEAREKRGESYLQRGNESAAMHQFNRAEQALGMNTSGGNMNEGGGATGGTGSGAGAGGSMGGSGAGAGGAGAH